MRFFIQGPCYVEVDGPILIEPAPEPADSHTPPVQSPETPTLNVAWDRTGTDTFTPPGSKRRHPHRRVCKYCGVLFMGRSNQLFCQDTHKAAYYRSNGGK